MLSVSSRTFRRYVDRYHNNGLDGLLDKRLTQASSRKAPVDEVMAMVDRYKNRYNGWTGKQFHSWYQREGGTRSSLQGVKNLIEQRGLFCSFYSDRESHYWHTPEAGGKVDKSNPTQFGRTLKQLGIEMIAAYSPQARGRSERVFSTHQSRLVKELALYNITTMAGANRYLDGTLGLFHGPKKLAHYNQQGELVTQKRAQNQ